MNRQLARIYIVLVTVVSLLTLIYTTIVPLQTMYVTADGVKHLSPPVINLDTGEPIELSVLVRHFKGD